MQLKNPKTVKLDNKNFAVAILLDDAITKKSNENATIEINPLFLPNAPIEDVYKFCLLTIEEKNARIRKILIRNKTFFSFLSLFML